MESLVTPALLLPAGISLGLIAFHLAAGGPEVVRPLLSSRELPPEVVYTLYLCWHIVTIVLIASLLVYAAAAIDSGFRPYAFAATVIAGAVSLLSFVVVVWKRQKHREMPQWAVFLLLALAGMWALS